jgi:hypothetical protein
MAAPPGSYPTFAKAKNLAMAYALNTQDVGEMPPLPSERNGLELFPAAEGVKSLSPTIEFENEPRYFTNLFQFD